MENDSRSFDDVSTDMPEGKSQAAETFQAWRELGLDHGSHSSLIGANSAATALLGLGIGSFLTAVLIPVLLDRVMNSFGTRPTFLVTSLLFMPIMFPTFVLVAISIAVPCFWYVSVLLRFLVAVCLFAPSAAGLFMSIVLVEGPPPDGIVFEFTVICLCGFVAAATTGLLAQMCTPWTLSHRRLDSREPLPRLGTGTLMELTVVVAVTIAFATALQVKLSTVANLQSQGGLLIGCLTFAGISAFATATGIVACIGFLRETRPSRRAMVVASTTAFLASFIFVSGIAVGEFGWGSAFLNLHYTCPLALVGTLIILAVMAGCLYWLRFCGWRCVR